MAIKAHAKAELPVDGIKRVIIKNIKPTVEHGQYPAKGTVGEQVKFVANIISDGHDKIFARILLREKESKTWREAELKYVSNDWWETYYLPHEPGILEFKVQAWISELDTWKDAFEKKAAAGADIKLDELKGLQILEHIASLSGKAEQKEIKNLWHQHKEKGLQPSAIDQLLYKKMLHVAPKEKVTTTATYHIDIERKRARFSTWYELFPRSCAPLPGGHGTFHDVIQKLPELASAGFDVLYLPPIHPIGKMKRKGKNNSLVAGPMDPGSPWAIGSDEGGHKSLHPELGTMDDFKRLIKEARKHDIEIAMDIAFQCAPDHPYVTSHPEWFKWRADGTVQFAENPPKKYEDILPFDFESSAWQSLWEELLSIFTFWIGKGIKIFRVDNPHTKSLKLWEWIIASIKKTNPEVIFLAEAFTRPAVMEHLAMAGFTQSYTYFTWRNTKTELETYITELTQTYRAAFFRPNFWPNTPDILPEHLVNGGEPMHIIRLLLAATLSSNYGIYGPVFERGINVPMPGKEEYIDNEKYEIKHWSPLENSRIWDTIRKVNNIRKSFPALQYTNNIELLNTSNDMIMAYLKRDDINFQHLIVIINLDEKNTQSGWVNVPFEELSKLHGPVLHITDQLYNDSYEWSKDWNYVELSPQTKPAHIFSILPKAN
jgi:starch synthase (maltosyl-transferring)